MGWYDWDTVKDALVPALAIAVVLYLVSCGAVGLATNSMRNGEIAGSLLFWVALIGIPLGASYEQDRAARKRLEARLQQERAERERQDSSDQQSYRLELEEIPGSALRLFEGLPKKLLVAEEHLDRAAVDYSEGAFAPFWQSIEQATLLLGSYNDDLLQTSALAKRHAVVKARYRGRTEGFPLATPSARAAASVTASVQRLGELVRTAQRNFQFAMIYEQRKTNQILVAGFTTLAGALEGMAQRIAGSIADLTAAVETSSAALHESMEGVAGAVNDHGADLQSSLRSGFGELQQRHDKALEMLDNLQRRRMPRPRGLRDGEY